jgi:hypothetical protein
MEQCLECGRRPLNFGSLSIIINNGLGGLFLRLISVSFVYPRPSKCWSLLILVLRCLQLWSMDWSCRVRITLFSVVVDAFHVQEEVAIQLFLRIIIFFMYSLCTPFATVSLEFGIVFLWVLHTYPPPPHSSSEGCPAERECLHHRLSQCHWLQQWVPHDILRFRTRCGTPGSRASSGRLPQRVFCPSYIKVHTAPFNDKLRYIMLTMIEQVLKRKSRLEIKPRTFDPCTLAWCEAVTTVHEKRSLVSQYSKFETFLYVNRREECL